MPRHQFIYISYSTALSYFTIKYTVYNLRVDRINQLQYRSSSMDRTHEYRADGGVNVCTNARSTSSFEKKYHEYNLSISKNSTHPFNHSNDGLYCPITFQDI
ncbi:hypothetical protein SF1_26390 [Sphingobacterium faecium NBRC 15299]|nr:hypothetical protein SF1_26390 [Sphingobacterium faecium NBRC 15299]